MMTSLGRTISKKTRTTHGPPVSQTRTAHYALYLLAAIIYLIGIIEVQLGIILIGPDVGFLFCAGLLLLLLIHATREAGHFSGLLLGLAYVVVIRMASFSVPPANFPPMLWVLVIMACLLGGVVWLGRTLTLSAADIGLVPRKPLVQILVALSGILIGLVQFIFIEAGFAVKSVPLTTITIASYIALVGQAVLDEVLFRGIMQHVSAPIFRSFSALYVALVYAALHIGYGSPVNIGFVLAVALYYGLVRELTDSIMGVMMSHLLANFTLLVLLATGLLAI